MTDVKTSQELNPILIVEDSDVDFDIFLAALEHHKIQRPIDRVETGEDALLYLKRCADSPNEIPTLVIVDLNLMGISGLDVIREAKTIPKLARVPFVVLSTSSSPKDQVSAHEAGADSYLCKPIDFDQFQRMIDRLVADWLIARRFSARFRTAPI